MSNTISIRKGLDIRLVGEATTEIKRHSRFQNSMSITSRLSWINTENGS